MVQKRTNALCRCWWLRGRKVQHFSHLVVRNPSILANFCGSRYLPFQDIFIVFPSGSANFLWLQIFMEIFYSSISVSDLIQPYREMPNSLSSHCTALYLLDQIFFFVVTFNCTGDNWSNRTDEPNPPPLSSGFDF